EVDLGVHDDPVRLAVRPGQIPVEAHRNGVNDLSHQSLLSPTRWDREASRPPSNYFLDSSPRLCERQGRESGPEGLRNQGCASPNALHISPPGTRKSNRRTPAILNLARSAKSISGRRE